MKQSALLVFLYYFGFNPKKKSCRKSKYLQSIIQYLTEYLTIHIWRSRKTLSKRQPINDLQSTKQVLRVYCPDIYTAVYCGKIFAVSTFVTHMTLQLFLFYFKKNEECLPEDRIQTYFCKGDFKSPKARGLRTPNEGINQRYLKNWARQNMLRPHLKIWDWDWIFGRAVKAIQNWNNQICF